MKRVFESALLVFAIGVLVVLGWSREGAPPSDYSTFDAGPNGYEALYDVLQREGVPVMRLQQPIGLMPASVRVLVVTATIGDEDASVYSAGDLKKLGTFVKGGGLVAGFGVKNGNLPKKSLHYDVRAFTNLALERDPVVAARIYDALAGRGLVAFDERAHGYGADRTLWSVLPAPVRLAFWLVVLALLLALVGTNVRFAPAVATEPPMDRDSSDYIESMARLLRRARAPHVAYDRKDHS